MVIILLVFTWSSSYAESEKERERIQELDNKCQEARAEKLKPLQEEQIENCVSEEGKPRDYCERYYATYGWGGTSGRFRNQRFFDDIPECVAAFEAWKNRER
jgi:hypothetical protein